MIILRLVKERKKQVSNHHSLKTDKESYKQSAFIIMFIIVVSAYLNASTKEDEVSMQRKRNKLIPLLKFKRLLFVDNKEEILGDLYEQKEMLLAEGLTETQVNKILFKEKVFILFFQYWGKIQEWFLQQTKIMK